MFDKRIENYLLVNGLIELYSENISNLNHENDEPLLTIDLEFIWLTNNTYLQNIAPAIKHPLKEPHHINFLIKLEDLNNLATKIKFLFSGKEALFLGDFVLCYKDLLYAMYQYKIILDKMDELSQNHNYTLEETQNKLREKEHRKPIIVAFNNLNQAYIILKQEDVEQQIQKQIQLK